MATLRKAFITATNYATPSKARSNILLNIHVIVFRRNYAKFQLSTDYLA